MTERGVRRLLRAGAGLAAMGSAGSAIAAPTIAGTVITNQAQATYTVNNIPATASSTVASFVVDRKVAFTTVSAQATTTKVSIGQANVVTTFTLTNITNGTQDFILEPEQLNLPTGVLIGTDNFNVDNIRVFVDSNNNQTYDIGVDTGVFIDELAPDTSVTVFIVGDVGSPANPEQAFVALHATVAAGGATGTPGAALNSTDLALLNREGVEDIVFADDDSDGLALGDLPRNGQGRAYAAYEIGTRAVALTIAKSARFVSDGVNLLTPARALPGAIVEYCLTVTNTTPLVPANSVALTDIVPANTTFVPGSILVGGLGTGDVCVGNGFPQNDDGSNTIGPYTGSYDAATRTVRAGIPAVILGIPLSASFRVTIN
ncbi:DUF11 domain-containing protein [Sphingomonas montana]|uniref:DUF11 domain-containing protein n=1 Tax=Sphingomonas montana TaxID=1843236 RepID=UPI00096D9FA7|nr:DUF11 domain-containing protein [Sphingomonas montana]